MPSTCCATESVTWAAGSACLLHPGQWIERETRVALPGQHLLGCAAAPLQREEQQEPGPGPLPQRIPIFTAELKNPLTGQDVEDAIRQYRTDRDPRELLFAYGRCLAHFAVDPDLVYVTTHLVGPQTYFLPFNQGKFGGAGNPPVPPTMKGYPTSYLWEETWARDSVLDLVRQFIHEVQEKTSGGGRQASAISSFPATSKSTACDGWWPTRVRTARASAI